MISSQQLGERISTARKRQKLTQANVASQLGVARTTLVAVEKGERRPSSAELVNLARILGVSVNDLVRQSAVEAEVSPRFRAGRKVDPEVLVAVERLRTFATRYVELEQMHGLARRRAPLEHLETYRQMEAPPSVAVAAAEGAEAAQAVRSLLGMGDSPAHDIEQRLEAEAGLRIFSLDRLPAHIAAFLIWSDEIGGCVAVNRAHPIVRQRWSLAHEFGHFLRDRELGDVMETEEPYGPQEWFPEAFAREFLMPTTGVRRRFAELCRAGRFTSVDLYALAEDYGVAFQAMAWRLEELNLLPKGTYQKIVASNLKTTDLAKQASGSPAEMRKGRSLGLPDRYLALAISAFDQGYLSEREFADYIKQDVATARATYADRSILRTDDHLELAVSYSESDLRAQG